VVPNLSAGGAALCLTEAAARLAQRSLRV
jgi:hypothetical protein